MAFAIECEAEGRRKKQKEGAACIYKQASIYNK
jgi:hypothetical protein